MCKGRNKEFMRCYTMQARFLKALGFGGMVTTGVGGEEERIQMHADRLYHEMLDREERSEEVKKNLGLAASSSSPLDTVAAEEDSAPLISPESTTAALGENSAWARARQKALAAGTEGVLAQFSPERQEQIRQQMEGMSPREKELELQLVLAEQGAQREYAEQIRERMEEERVGRMERRGRGRETVGDSIKRLWGWDKGL